MKDVPVWDLPTRLFHWLLTLSVGTNLIIGPRGGWQFPVHVTAGCVALALVLFRMVWGFIGSRHSLFPDFVRGPRVVLQHLRALLKLQQEPHTGHNPLGGWMVVTLLVMTLVTATTGLFSATRRGQSGPFASLIGGQGLGGIHGTLGNLMIFLVILHLCGVALHYLVTRENIVGAMVTGHKRLDAESAAAESPLVSRWRAVIPAALALALAVYLWSQAHFVSPDTAAAFPPASSTAMTGD
jgi:cytochrome b